MTIRSLSAIGFGLAALMLAGFARAQDDSALAQRQSRFNAYQAEKARTEEARKTGVNPLQSKLDELRAKSRKLTPAKRGQAKQIFSESYKLFQGGDFEAAKLGFMRGLVTDPANGQAQYFLAETLVRLNDAAGAHDRYELSQALAPNTAEGLKAETALAKMPKTDSIEILWDCAECPEMIAIPGKNYVMGIYEVTQTEWEAVMGNNPSLFKGSSLPVERVSWNDVQEYIKKLNQKTGKNYRLPKETEWEHACNGGSPKEFCRVNENAMYYEVDGQTDPVGQKQANGYGLYDMIGNVWEWMEDCGEGGCGLRVFRGGAWNIAPSSSQTVLRGKGDATIGFAGIVGFRLVRMLP